MVGRRYLSGAKPTNMHMGWDIALDRKGKGYLVWGSFFSQPGRDYTLYGEPDCSFIFEKVCR